jgi:hypothetical protein
MASTASEVKKSISDLRLFHRCGSFILRRAEGSTERPSAAVQQELDRRNPDTLYKFRNFADPTKGYTPKELHELCTQCQEHSRVWGVKHIIVILRVAKEGRQRNRMQLQALKKGWGANRLEAEIRRQYGRRRQGGRKRPIMKSEVDVLFQFERLCDSWLRLFRDLDCEFDREEERIGSVKLSPNSRTAIKQASLAVRLLHTFIKTRLP